MTREVLITTSLAAESEPRAPRHALAARKAFPDARIVFIECRPQGAEANALPEFVGQSIETRTIYFPTKTTNAVGLAFGKARVATGRMFTRITGAPTQSVFGIRTLALENVLAEYDPDLIVAHNIECFLPAYWTAKAKSARFVFDCMEYYSSMGDAQTAVEAAQAELIQQRYLKDADLVLSTSSRLSAALRAEYGVRRTFSSYNVPYLAPIGKRTNGSLRLYWRNSVIGLGQRGLEDILIAMQQLPEDVELYLQGRLGADNGARIRALLKEMGISDRVKILAPYKPSEAVAMAAPYDVGLCLEREGPRNHELTVSNKMFDYHMAGLAVVTSDMPALKDVVTASGGGLTYRAGCPQSLAEAISLIRSNRKMLAEMQSNARRFAEREGNREREIERISAAFHDLAH